MILSVAIASLTAEAQDVPKVCEPIVIECLQIMDLADKAIAQKQYETDMERQLRKDVEARSLRLQTELDNANIWYKKPEVVGPIALFIGLTAGALLKGR